MKNTLNDEKLKDKFSDEDKKTIEDTSAEGLQWLEGNMEASAEEFEAKQKELEGKFNPIMMKVYQAAGGAPGGMPGGMVVCQVAQVECQTWELEPPVLPQTMLMTLTEHPESK